MSIQNELFIDLRCPVCSGQLVNAEKFLSCQSNDCLMKFPVIDGIPVIINEARSVFSIQDFLENKVTTMNLKESKLIAFSKKFIPSISNNIKAKTNYKKILSLLRNRVDTAKVLIIGGSILGEGIEVLINEPTFKFVESDVSFGPRTQIIFDAHNIPFPDEFFDCIIVQAVLEHVVDPFICVSEIHRVLKKDGLVYAETPFMQQVHLGKFDFHRFTHIGHRRLFRNFQEIDSGAVCGPGMALAWAYSYFVFSFSSSPKIRKMLIPFTRFTSFFLKYFDYLLINNPGTLDAASGYFFLGSKSEEPLPDKKLLELYQGLL